MEQIARNGNTDLTKERAMEKFLYYMPKKYEQIVMLIETLLDFEQLTIEDVTGRLKAVQDHGRGLTLSQASPEASCYTRWSSSAPSRRRKDPDHPAPPRSIVGDHTAARRRSRVGLGLRQVLMAVPLVSAR